MNSNTSDNTPGSTSDNAPGKTPGNHDSIVETVKNYINAAKVKGQEVLSSGYEQLSHAAAQAQAKASGIYHHGGDTQTDDHRQQSTSTEDAHAEVDRSNVAEAEAETPGKIDSKVSDERL
ncbi:hypothetical protein BGX21_007016 [Mortierella sp. AD011]|nr:hypothetical protein BGX20_006964 [Mortierella sp. AD010]KAF9367868.1 hypothetical protein BGX21_007016 [Mortierella sp. AD011]